MVVESEKLSCQPLDGKYQILPIVVEDIVRYSKVSPLITPYERRLLRAEIETVVNEIIKQANGRLNDWMLSPEDKTGEEIIEMLLAYGISHQGANQARKSFLKNSIDMMLRGAPSVKEFRNFRRNSRKAKILPFENHQGGQYHSGHPQPVSSDKEAPISDYHTEN
ncbi:MAG: hypothetical protein M1142_04030 [Patescibacteria group bacterium]|nr:hypothetical protein [Patescibacteria group bacterium]